jgi:hypothetical protein
VTVSKGSRRRVVRCDDVDSLVNGDRLSSQGSFGTGQLPDFDHAQIGGHTVTKRKNNDITGNNLGAWDPGFFSITDDDSITGKHRCQGFSGFFGRTFLDDTNGGVDTDKAKEKTNGLDVVENCMTGLNNNKTYTITPTMIPT